MSGKYEPLRSVVAEYDNKIRKSLAAIDRSIGSDTYEMEKLKLLACSILPVGDVKSVESVAMIFDFLSRKFPDDLLKRSSALVVMLKAAGVESKDLPSSKEALDLFDGSFHWRKTLIQFSDRAEKKKKVSMVIDYLYSQYHIETPRKNVTLISLFDYLIQTGQYIPGSEKELKVLRKYFKTLNKYKYCQWCSLVVAVLCILAVLLLVALLILYITKTETRQYKQTLFYSDKMTLRAGEPTDVRFHDLVALSLKSLEDDTNNILYNVSVCQADCNNDIYASMDVSSDQNIQFLDKGRTRQFMRFDNVERLSIPVIFMLKNSHIDMNFTLQGTSPGTSLILNVFTDVRDCESFRAAMPGITPSQIISLKPSQQFSYTFRPKTKNGDFYCIVMESPPDISYDYYLSGVVSQYKSAKSLCTNVMTQHVNLEHLNSINVTLQRSLKSVSSVLAKEACVLVTFEKQDGCQFKVCPLSMNTTVYGTMKNIRIVSLSTLGLFSLIAAFSFTLIFIVLCIKS